MASIAPLRLQTLMDVPGLSRFDLPVELEEIYGTFGLPPRVLYANFVTSIDGIAAVPEIPRSSALISGGDPGDRFVVGLLRACADAILIGAGTLRAHRGPWTAENAYPDQGAGFAELRRRLDAAAPPRLVVVTGSGDLGAATSKLRGAIVVTSDRGAGPARASAGGGAEIVVAEPLDPGGIVTMLRERGYGRILTEGGPTLMGQLLEGGLVDELFLTVSPIIAGAGERPRPTLAPSVDLISSGPPSLRLLSARGRGSYLFLRYGSPREGPRGGDRERPGSREHATPVMPGTRMVRDAGSRVRRLTGDG
ncbi:MAG: dihydrofolate reductase family protein [Actinomycetota bacterium]